MQDDRIARAIACFEASEDIDYLRDILRAIRPKVEAAVIRAVQAGKDVPPPRRLDANAGVADEIEAMATVRLAKDLKDLQALARSAGHRAEELAASQ